MRVEHDYDIHGGHAPGCRGCEIERLTAALAQMREELEAFLKGRVTKSYLLERAEQAEHALERLRVADQLADPRAWGFDKDGNI